MKPTGNTNTRKPYAGHTRSLVLALDIGTTFSGVSYAILEPGEVPKIHGVTRFPGQEHVAGNAKIPSIMYYDKSGKMRAAGAEAESVSVSSEVEDEGWIKVELFKLRLRPKTMKLQMNGMRLNPLPLGKTATDAFGDFLSYLYNCTRSFISDTHANGLALWNAVENDIQFVLSHPNGWEGAQQTKMRRSAIYGGLIPDNNEGKARIRFVTEGEASLHACILSGLAADVLSNPSKPGFLIADAGGGTLDVSTYAIRGTVPLVIEEIAPPDCVFAGSVFVSRRARVFFEEKLKNSKYGSPEALDHITKRFDETTKRLFRDSKDNQFVPFGTPLDKDVAVGIRGGQLKLTGQEVADLFEPSVEAAVVTIQSQIEATSGVVKSVWLVGGFAASPYLFNQLKLRLAPFNVTVNRPDSQTSKAVADGAIGFYLDHHVSARMSKYMYGVEYLRDFDPQDEEHVSRKHRLCELPSGPSLLPDAFDCILARGVKVKESTVFSRKYCTELTNLSTLSVFEVDVWCYRGGNTVPKWILREIEEFSTLCVVRADLSPLSGSAKPKSGRNGRMYWTVVFSVEVQFGLTEFKARIKWTDDGKLRYGPASIIYNEGGTRRDEAEADSSPEDEPSIAPSRREKPSSAPVSRALSPVRPANLSRENGKTSSPYGHVAFVDAVHPRNSAHGRASSQAGSTSYTFRPYVGSGDSKREDKGKARELERSKSEKAKGKEANPNYPPVAGSENLDFAWGTSRTLSSSSQPNVPMPSTNNHTISRAKAPLEKAKETESKIPNGSLLQVEQIAETPGLDFVGIPAVTASPPAPQENASDPTLAPKRVQRTKKKKIPVSEITPTDDVPNMVLPMIDSTITVNGDEIPEGQKGKRKSLLASWGMTGNSVDPSPHVSDLPVERVKAPGTTPWEPAVSADQYASNGVPPVQAPPEPSTPPKMELPMVQQSPPLSTDMGALLGSGLGTENHVNGGWMNGDVINGDGTEDTNKYFAKNMFETARQPVEPNGFSLQFGFGGSHPFGPEPPVGAANGLTDVYQNQSVDSLFGQRPSLFDSTPNEFSFSQPNGFSDTKLRSSPNLQKFTDPEKNDRVELFENVDPDAPYNVSPRPSWETSEPTTLFAPVEEPPPAVITKRNRKKNKGSAQAGSLDDGITPASEEPSTLFSSTVPLSANNETPSPLDVPSADMESEEPKVKQQPVNFGADDSQIPESSLVQARSGSPPPVDVTSGTPAAEGDDGDKAENDFGFTPAKKKKKKKTK